MSRKIAKVAAFAIIAALIVSMFGCSSSASDTSSQSSIQTNQQTQVNQQQSGDQGQNPRGQRGQGMDNTQLLTRVAEILNVSVEDLTTAYNNAMPQREEGQGGPGGSQSPTGEPPSGEMPTGEPPSGTPPADGQGGQQPPQMQGFPEEMMQSIADELGLSVDDVTAAFEQAMQELIPTTKQ